MHDKQITSIIAVEQKNKMLHSSVWIDCCTVCKWKLQSTTISYVMHWYFTLFMNIIILCLYWTRQVKFGNKDFWSMLEESTISVFLSQRFTFTSKCYFVNVW